MPGALVSCSLEAYFPDGRERLLCQFNPAAIEWDLEPEWGNALPFGASHETSGYGGTKSLRTPIELFFTLFDKSPTEGFPDLKGVTPSLAPVGQPQRRGVLFQTVSSPSLAAAMTQANAQAIATLAGVERFLQALCYSDPEAGMHTTPLVVWEWPGVLRIAGRIERLKLQYPPPHAIETLQPLVLKASIKFREDLDRSVRITTQEVRQSGALRGKPDLGGGGVDAEQGRQSVTISVPISADTIGG